MTPSTPTGGPPDRVMGGWQSLRDVLADAQRRLTAAGVPSPEVDASLLAAHVLGVPRGRLYLQDPMPGDQRMAFERLLSRRVARVPLQHLLGSAPFRTIELSVGPGVFVPRPETERVAGTAIDALRALPASERIAVDLCTGSGAIAIAMAVEVDGCSVTGVEVDPAAARWARTNAERYAGAVATRSGSVRIVEADATRCAGVGGQLAELAGAAAVVVMNPPYVPEGAVVRDPEVRDHDPARALYGGPDGLRVIRGAIDTAAILLRAGGQVVIEHSDEQGESAGESGVPGVLRMDSRWRDVTDHLDLARRPRFTTATRAV